MVYLEPTEFDDPWGEVERSLASSHKGRGFSGRVSPSTGTAVVDAECTPADNKLAASSICSVQVKLRCGDLHRHRAFRCGSNYSK